MYRSINLTFAVALLSLALYFGNAVANQAASTAEETTPLAAGNPAPEGSFFDAEGNEVPLKEIYSEQPAILVYYRGDWCRYCNQHLRNLKNIEDELVEIGYKLVAISADKPEILVRTQEKEDLPYRILSDSSMEMAKRFGIAFKVSDETIEKYKGYEIDLEGASGHDHHLLPVPSVFLIDKKGTILWTYSDPQYSQRLDSADLLKVAKEKKQN